MLVAYMTEKEKVIKLAEENNGLLMTNQVSKAGISRYTLGELVSENRLSYVQRGIYVTEKGYADDYFLLQQRFPKGVYSHETALFLLEFTDRIPLQFVMTFKQGTSTSRMKKDNIHPVMVSHHFEDGIINVKRSGGTFVRVYCIERTLVDMLKKRYDADFEQLIPAIKQYAKYKDKNINGLFRYAKLFNVETQIRNYMGVLL